jgi:hypothetical protein
LLYFRVFNVVLIFEHIEPRFDKQVHKIFINFMIWEKGVDVGIEKRKENFEAFLLGNHDSILFELTGRVWLVILSPLALVANILGVLRLAVVTHEPSDQVSVRF